MPDALPGLRVVEVTTAVAGPIAGHVLGDMGAEVIKIEQPRTPPGGLSEESYRWAPRPPNYNELNRSKQSLALDLAKPRGRDIFLRLVERADAVVENFSPRVMPNLGLDYPDLVLANPALIMVSMPAFGKSGPYRDRSSYGPGIDAMSGLSHLTGYPDRGPGKPGNYFCDQNAGLHAALALLAAVRYRRRTGRGQHVELAMLDGELQYVAPALMDYVLNGRVQRRIGNRHTEWAPQGVYPCAGEDQWVAISVRSDAEWNTLCKAIDRADLASSDRYATAAGRRLVHDQIDALITEWTVSRSKGEVETRLQAAGLAAAAALDVSELFVDSQLHHRESFAWVEHPEAGTFPHTRTAWRSRSGQHGVSAPAPVYGQDTRYVLGTLLGISDQEITELTDSGVTGVQPVTD